MILGMEPAVFAAWIGTIILAGLCVFYGLWHEFLKDYLKRGG